MPTRVENLLRTARITLADIAAQRWDDDTLLAILNEAQIDFCQQTQVLHNRTEVPIFVGLPDFNLPDDCWLLTRVLYNNRVIPLVTHRELDEMSPRSLRNDFNFTFYGGQWEDITGKPEAIVYDRHNLSLGKVFPIPNEGDTVVDYTFTSATSASYLPLALFGVASGVENDDDVELEDAFGVVSDVGSLTGDTLDSAFGVTTSLLEDIEPQAVGYGVLADLDDYELDTVYGVLVDLEDPDVATEEFNSPYGVVSTIEESCLVLKCYYLQNPGTIDSLDSEIMIPSMYDIALKFYLVGQAFLNDLDAASQAKAQQQLLIYERHVATAKKDSARDFTQAGQFQTTYRRGV